MERKSLRELTDHYFQKKKHFKLDYDHKIDKHNQFDIVITLQDKNEQNAKKIGVLVCDINRSIGLNVLRKVQCMLEDTEEINEAILVGSNFSSQVRKFSKTYNIQILSEGEIKRETDLF